MAKINRINPDGISRPFSNYSHVVTAEGADDRVAFFYDDPIVPKLAFLV